MKERIIRFIDTNFIIFISKHLSFLCKRKNRIVRISNAFNGLSTGV